MKRSIFALAGAAARGSRGFAGAIGRKTAQKDPAVERRASRRTQRRYLKQWNGRQHVNSTPARRTTARWAFEVYSVTMRARDAGTSVFDANEGDWIGPRP
jgi:hypothetical protein